MVAEVTDNGPEKLGAKEQKGLRVRKSLIPDKNDDGLVWSGKFCGGIRNDIARKLPWYGSDWVDGLRAGPKTVTAALFMFFACLAPGIAFGAYMDQHSKGQVGVVEYLVTQGVGGVIFAIFSGQPLIMLRPTGPITVFLTQLFNTAGNMDLPFLVVQAWTGIFVGIYMLIIAVTDGCALIRHCSRFTCDLFGFFVCSIFIFMGTMNILDKFNNKADLYRPTHQFILTVLTVWLAWTLANFNKAKFFNKTIRDLASSFAVPAAIGICTAVGNILTVPVEPLPVPSNFEPTLKLDNIPREWIVDICPADGCGTAIAVGAIAALPLVMLFFVDQNVTTLLTQHRDHKLKKGGAFHYNFLMIGIFNIVFPLFGCPYITGSIPHSPQFVQALADKEVVREGGQEKVTVVKVYENRLAPLMVNVLILLCLPFVKQLSYIPTCVICDALFLFMGASGLPGNELFERIKLIFTEDRLYPPMRFTKEQVPRNQMHAFTCAQFFCVIVLFSVSQSPLAVAFPVFLVLTIPFRMQLSRISCGYISPTVIGILDHVLEPDDPNRQSSKDGKEAQSSETIDAGDTAATQPNGHSGSNGNAEQPQPRLVVASEPSRVVVEL